MKQRIIGAIVLAALAVILLPMALDFNGQYKVDRSSQIPERPSIAPVDIAPERTLSPESIELSESASNADQMFHFEAGRKVAKEQTDDTWLQEEPPALSTEGVPKAWILQVASFSEPDKAKALTEKLRGDKYKAYSRVSSGEEKTVYRVYVGPKILKTNLLQEQLAIEEKYKIQTLLLRFEP